MQERRPQVEGQGKLNCAFLRWRLYPAGGMTVLLEARQPLMSILSKASHFTGALAGDVAADFPEDISPHV